jgi:fimbrial isopeptide formation D2 family protein
MSITIDPPGTANIEDWQDLRNAIADPSVTTIKLKNNIQRDTANGGTAATNDLPQISRDLTIDGNGYTLDFRSGGASTAINRPGFILAQNLTHAFTLKNIIIIRNNATTYSLIAAATNSGGTSYCDFDDSNVTQSAGWTVNINGVKGDTSLKPTAGLISLPNGRVNFTGTNDWSLAQGASYAIINATNVYFSDGTKSSFNAQKFPVIFSETSSNSTHTLSVTGDGTVVDMYALGNGGSGASNNNTGAIKINIDNTTANRADISITNKAVLNITSDGWGDGDEGATVLLNAGAGSIVVNAGAKLNVSSLCGVEGRPNTTNAAGASLRYRGQPAIMMQIQGGTFTVDGDGSEMNVESYGASNNYGGVLRFRNVGGQIFTVSNKAKVSVVSHYRPGGSKNPAAIRFGIGVNNGFHVTSGGIVYIHNEGDGTVDDGKNSLAGGNDGIEFDANDFMFEVSGAGSQIEVISDYGPAVDARGRNNGAITLADKAKFVAYGNTPSKTDAIFMAGNNFKFTSDAGLYYDFANTRVGGGTLFAVGSGSTFTSKDTDIAVWGNGLRRDNGTATGANDSNSSTDPISGNPYMDWTLPTFNLSGSNFTTFGTSNDTALTTATTSFGNSGFVPYTRISGNNSTPKVIDLFGDNTIPLTNADKHVRAIATVPEGFDMVDRAIWDDELFARFYVTHPDSTGGEVGAGTVIDAFNQENVWEQETYTGNPLQGVLRYDKGAFLSVGDKYKIASAWRGQVNDPSSTKIHKAEASDITTEELTVIDKTPPQKVTITDPTGTALFSGRKKITGTYLNATQQSGTYPYNPEVATKIYAVRVPAGSTTGTEVKDSGGNLVLAVLDAATSKWEYAIPDNLTLAKDDKLYIVAEDANGNKNPLVDTLYHDAKFDAAPYLTVKEGPSSFTKSIVTPSDSIVTNAAADITWKLTADMPTDMSAITAVVIKDELLTGLKLKNDDIANITVSVVNKTTGAVIAGAATPTKSFTSNTATVSFGTVTNLAGNRIVIEITTNLVPDGSNVLPSQVQNGGSIYFNGELANTIDTLATVSIKGKISGKLFNDLNGDGLYGGSDTAAGSQTVTLINTADNSETTAVTAADGSYSFIVAPGTYKIKAPVMTGKGYTTKSALSVAAGSHVGNDGKSDSLAIDLSNGGANLEKTINAGYAAPTINNATDAFTKKLLKVGNTDTGGPIYDATADLTYEIVYKMPASAAGYNHLEIRDVLYTGLKLKDADIANFNVKVYKNSVEVPGFTGTKTYGAGSGEDVGKMVAAFKFDDTTDFSQLAGAEIVMTVIAKVENSGSSWPASVTDSGRLIVNGDDSSAAPVAGPLTVQNTGRIYGVAYNDTNRNNVYDAGESPLAGVVIQLLDGTGTAISGQQVTTGADGKYLFNQTDGTYGLQFATPQNGMGLTSAPYDGKVTGIDVVIGSAQQSREINKGYNTPDPSVITDLENSLKKGVWQSSTSSYVSTTTITDFNATIEYKVSFDIPANLAGFASITIKDIMDAGLTLATVPAGDWNVKVTVDGTVIPLTAAQSVQSGNTAAILFDAAAIQNYLFNKGGKEVAVIVKANLEKVAGDYLTTVVNRGRITVNSLPDHDTANMNVSIAGNPPVMAFTRRPLVINQTPLSHIMTANEIKAEMTVYDDYDTMTINDVTYTLANGVSAIDTQYVGVYSATYYCHDSNGNNASPITRAIVVTDGRYIIDDPSEVILGARNFAAERDLVDGSDSQVRSWSYAESYDYDGANITSSIVITKPSGYVAKAPEGPYNFTLGVTGKNSNVATKAITGTIIDGHVDPGTKNSKYAVYAKDFSVTTTRAAQILADTTQSLFISEAGAGVILLTPDADVNAKVTLKNQGGFAAVINTSPGYPVQYGVDKDAQMAVTIAAKVTVDNPPTLDVTTPVEVQVGTGLIMNNGVVSANTFNINSTGVSTNDTEDGASVISSLVVTGSVDITKVGLYNVSYSVTDSGNSTVTKQRVVVVNDGRYSVGSQRILYARGFVKRLKDVTDNLGAINFELLVNSGAKLYNGTTGASIDGAAIESDGGYHKAVDVYNSIKIKGVDESSPETLLHKTITGEVVEADEITTGNEEPETGDNYTIFASNLTLTNLQAQNLLNAGDSAIISAAKAGARHILASGGLGNATVTIPSGGNKLQSTTGEYEITFAVGERNAVKVTIIANVSVGPPPTIDMNKPLVYPISDTPGNLSAAQILDGVTASDALGADLTSSVTYSAPDGSAITIPANVAGVTKVKYSVIDAAGNVKSDTRAVIIDDGSFEWDANYILKAKSFVINKNDVALTNAESQILTLSEGRAWDTDGDEARAIVSQTGGYSAFPATYTPQLTIYEYPAMTKTISAMVIEGTGTNGDKYAITAKDFRININDAKILLSQKGDADAYLNNLKSPIHGDVYSYQRTNNLTQAGTILLDSDGGFSALSPSDLVDGYVHEFTVTFKVAQESDTKVSIKMLVSNANPPVLYVPSVKKIAVGAAFAEGAKTDTDPSYMQGIYATDEEDDNDILSGAITHDTPVDSAAEGAYKVTYSVTDSDNNTTTKSGLVLVGDWIIGTDYAIKANDFTKDITEVSGTQSEAISYANATAICIDASSPDFGNSETVIVKSDGGYYGKMPGNYTINFAVQKEQTTNVSIIASVGKGNIPVITLEERPLVIQKTSTSHNMTSSEIKDKLSVYDAEDSGLGGVGISVSDVTYTLANGVANIDTKYVGVYSATYNVTDSHGNDAVPKKRAIVVTDGRYIIDNSSEVILGARNFAAEREKVDGSITQVRSWSYAEGYDFDGENITAQITVTKPAAYVAKAPEGPYNFNLSLTGKAGNTATKNIVGTIIDGKVDPGTKDSKYSVYAKDFSVTTTRAKEILADISESLFISEAGAGIVLLTPDADTAAKVMVKNKGGFAAVVNTDPGYEIVYGVDKDSEPGVAIDAKVTADGAPTLNVTTPIEIEPQSGLIISNGNVTTTVFNEKTTGVSADDAEDGSAYVLSTLIVTGSVDKNKVGIYTLSYTITDKGGNTVTARRVVVVNDGRYIVGSERILYARGFVAKLADVTSDASKINAEILSRSGAKVYSALSGEQTDGAAVEDDGGFTKAVGVYDAIKLSAINTSSPETLIRKTITGEVVDADEIKTGPEDPEKGDNYTIYANNIQLTTNEAADIISGGDSALIAAAKAKAKHILPNGTLSNATVVIPSGGNELKALQGEYEITFAVDETKMGAGSAASYAVSVTIIANVSIGAPPTISMNKPLVYPLSSTAGNLSDDEILVNVRAQDNLANDITDSVEYTDSNGDPITIPKDEPGVYEVKYTATDGVGNIKSDSRAVIIDDGSFSWDENYIISAKSFVIAKSKVEKTGKEAQILTLSEAGAWDIRGRKKEVALSSVGGYTDSVGTYTPVATITDYPSMTKTISAMVYDDETGGKGVNGAKYSLTGKDFTINSAKAKELLTLKGNAAEYLKAMIQKSYADVHAWLRTNNLTEGGTITLIKDAFGSIDPQILNNIENGLTYELEFSVAEEPDTTIKINLIISNGNPPVLNVPAYKVIPKNAIFPVGAREDENPSYKQGVFATDDEDDNETLTNSITNDSEVKTDTEGVYLVNYSVTDSDGNKVDKIGLVLVGDWIIGEGYAIAANDFEISISEVTGTETQAIENSKARAVCIDPDDPNFGKAVRVIVSDDGGYYEAEMGTYDITFAVEAENSTKVTITALIGGAGQIYGIAFKDTNRNGIKDIGEEGIEGIKVQLYSSNGGRIVEQAMRLMESALTPLANLNNDSVPTGNAIKTVTTAEDGGFRFLVTEGTYEVLFEKTFKGMGLSIEPKSGLYSNIAIDLSDGGVSARQVNAGYAYPNPLSIKSIKDTFKKEIKEGLSYVTEKSIYDSTGLLEYKISFMAPADMTGIAMIELRDIMEDGLIFASDTEGAWNVKVTVDGSVYKTLELEGSVASVVLSGDGMNAWANKEIAMFVRAKLSKVSGAYVRDVKNGGEIVLNDSEKSPSTDPDNKSETIKTPENQPKVTNTGRIYGYAYADINKNEIRETNESLLAGVVIEILDKDGKKVALETAGLPLRYASAGPTGTSSGKITTDSTGHYSIDVPAGTYQVKFSTRLSASTISGGILEIYKPAGGTLSSVTVTLGASSVQNKEINASYYIPPVAPAPVPNTGDQAAFLPIVFAFLVSAEVLMFLLLWIKKREREKMKKQRI